MEKPLPVGPLPPLGSFLDPWNGVWAVAATARFPARAVAHVPGLGDSVTVLYDHRGVPHIFATTKLDAIRALAFGGCANFCVLQRGMSVAGVGVGEVRSVGADESGSLQHESQAAML